MTDWPLSACDWFFWWFRPILGFYLTSAPIWRIKIFSRWEKFLLMLLFWNLRAPLQNGGSSPGLKHWTSGARIWELEPLRRGHGRPCHHADEHGLLFRYEQSRVIMSVTVSLSLSYLPVSLSLSVSKTCLNKHRIRSVNAPQPHKDTMFPPASIKTWWNNSKNQVSGHHTDVFVCLQVWETMETLRRVMKNQNWTSAPDTDSNRGSCCRDLNCRFPLLKVWSQTCQKLFIEVLVALLMSWNVWTCWVWGQQQLISVCRPEMMCATRSNKTTYIKTAA